MARRLDPSSQMVEYSFDPPVRWWRHGYPWWRNDGDTQRTGSLAKPTTEYLLVTSLLPTKEESQTFSGREVTLPISSHEH